MNNDLQVTLITTCMGRLDFLKQTLPTWLRNTNYPILVVDYSCPEGTADWASQPDFRDRVSVLRAKARAPQGVPRFNLSHARNLGAAASGTDYLLFLDADVEARPGLQEALQAALGPQALCCVTPPLGQGLDLAGVLAVPAARFEAAGGFDENFRGWGPETQDLKLRLLFSGIRAESIPMDSVRALPHDDALRSAHYAEKSIHASRDSNLRYLDEKLRRETGLGYRAWLRDPAARRLFFGGPARSPAQ